MCTRFSGLDRGETGAAWPSERSRAVIDRGLKPGTTSGEPAELAAAQRRIHELEDEVKILRKAAAAVQKVHPEDRFQLVAEMVDDGVDASAPVASSRRRARATTTGAPAPSTRSIRDVWLTDRIAAIHEASRGTYGALRVQAELVHA